MTQPVSEPTTEQEANDLKDFLEQGAQVELETLRQLEPVTVVITTDRITVADIPDTDRLMDELDTDADLQLRLTFDSLRPEPNFPVALLVNSPDVDDRKTLAQEGGFVGTFSFFGSEHAGHASTIFVLSAGDAFRRTEPDGVLQLSFIAMPEADREVNVEEFRVSVVVAVVASRVSKPGS